MPVAAIQLLLGGGRSLPSLLFVTSAQGLAANIGASEAAQVLAALRAAGQSVLDTLPAGQTSAQAAPLVQARLAQSPPVQGVVLLGGYDLILPQRLDALDSGLRQQLLQLPPTEQIHDPDDFIVWSDYVYADADGDGLADLPVSRIPDGKSAQLLVAALQAGGTATGTSWQGLRNIARPFADMVYAPLAAGRPMTTSKSVVFHQSPPFDFRADNLYLMLHGSAADGARFWGEGNPLNQEAMNLTNVPSQGGTVVFTGCCWGALCADTTALAARPSQPVNARTTDNSLALSFLKAGVTAFVGCTGSHYSPVVPPFNFYGQPMHTAFWRHSQAGAPPAKALFDAKMDYIAGMPHGQTTTTGRAIEMKILREYTCLGLGW